MNKARSIKQNIYPDALPNFRNLGVALRIVLLCNLLAVMKAFVDAADMLDIWFRLLQELALLAPVLLVSLLFLWFLQPLLQRWGYWRGAGVSALLVMAVTLGIYYFGGALYQPFAVSGNYFDFVQYAVISLMVCAVLLMYFYLRLHVLSRALHDARLQVLRARIRPHFLFNSINAVLSIVRTEPKRAEVALEDMSDLFRMAMADTDDLVLLSHEIVLCKQYLALEQLRMGARLRVAWQMEGVSAKVLIPPLLLQPLLENAVYHGIESLAQGGEIVIKLGQHGGDLQLVVENPCADSVVEPHAGNKMALQNIRERLELLFDVEARYQVERTRNIYRVGITLPCLLQEE